MENKYYFGAFKENSGHLMEKKNASLVRIQSQPMHDSNVLSAISAGQAGGWNQQLDSHL